MTGGRQFLRRGSVVAGVLVLLVVVGWMSYFPGRQSLLAITLATGVGVGRLQSQVDALEEKAIRGAAFDETEKRFLEDLYTCLYKGARLTFVLRQSAALMEHYLSRTGTDLVIEPRIFLGSGHVQREMSTLKARVRSDLRAGAVKARYTSKAFAMGDPRFLDSFAGLYVGRLTVTPRLQPDAMVLLEWHADMPWKWPSYPELQAQYGDYHALSFPLPNARSLWQGRQHSLKLDDGLGEYLVQIGLAKPFMVRSRWIERTSASDPR